MLSNLFKQTRTEYRTWLLSRLNAGYCLVRLKDRREDYRNCKSIELKNLTAMELRPRYTEETNVCDYDADFLETLRDFTKPIILRIIEVLEKNAELGYLPREDGWIQEMGCVLKGKDPFFFVIRFLHQTEDTPLFLEIEEIYCDDYLDFILAEKVLIDFSY
jgi:hypothetical protein|tara:strand:+ start:1568 stop:2050 length:483 start_codon:yes stop_codon:yes gene_type:complete